MPVATINPSAMHVALRDEALHGVPIPLSIRQDPNAMQIIGAARMIDARTNSSEGFTVPAFVQKFARSMGLDQLPPDEQSAAIVEMCTAVDRNGVPIYGDDFFIKGKTAAMRVTHRAADGRALDRKSVV